MAEEGQGMEATRVLDSMVLLLDVRRTMEVPQRSGGRLDKVMALRMVRRRSFYLLLGWLLLRV